MPTPPPFFNTREKEQKIRKETYGDLIFSMKKRYWFFIVIILSFLISSVFPKNIVSTWTRKTVFEIRLRWDPNPEPDLWRYNVYRSLSVTGPFDTMLSTGTLTIPKKGVSTIGTTVNGEALTTTTFVNSGLTSGIYSYVITAIDDSGNESGYSNVATKSVGLSWY